jgi:hypothetical protein
MRLDIDPLMPLSEQQLCLIVSAYADQHKQTTVPGFISAIAYLTETQGHGQLPRGALFDRVRAGLGNYFGDVESVPKAALTLDDLCSFYSHIQHNTFAGARDWCACVFAFFGLLRINEYMNGGLQYHHVQPHSLGVTLTIPFSKTSLVPAKVDIVSRDDALCPLRAFSAYSAFLLAGPLPPAASNPFFISQLISGNTAMTDAEFTARIRDIIRIALPGKNPMSYAGHSFRRGGATAMKLAGVSDSVIQQQGRWKSDAYRVYFDRQNNLDVRLLATQGLHTRPIA